MSGYTQEDIGLIAEGSRLSNKMKDEIALILNLVRNSIENVHKRQLFGGLKLRVDITETAFLDFIARNSVDMSVHVKIILLEGDKSTDPLGGLKISSVKAVHSALPKVLEEANKYYPEVGELVRQLKSFAAVEATAKVKKGVMDYVLMAIGIDAGILEPGGKWWYKDPRTGGKIDIKIDYQYMKAVETRMGLRSTSWDEDLSAEESALSIFRTNIRKICGQKIFADPNYDFMDNKALVKAVTEVLAETDR